MPVIKCMVLGLGLRTLQLHTPSVAATPVKIRVCACMRALLCPTLCNPTDGSLPGPSVYGIFQAKLLERVAIS